MQGSPLLKNLWIENAFRRERNKEGRRMELSGELRDVASHVSSRIVKEGTGSEDRRGKNG